MLDEPPSYSPKHNGSRIGDILIIAILVGLAGFLVAVVAAILTG